MAKKHLAVVRAWARPKETGFWNQTPFPSIMGFPPTPGNGATIKIPCEWHPHQLPYMAKRMTGPGKFHFAALGPIFSDCNCCKIALIWYQRLCSADFFASQKFPDCNVNLCWTVCGVDTFKKHSELNFFTLWTICISDYMHYFVIVFCNSIKSKCVVTTAAIEEVLIWVWKINSID